jgi:hydrophobic/amphiphilic exporter-1 (mainly G- bacteria), HAE1 family
VGSGLRTALSGSQVGTYAQAGQPNIPVIVRMDDAARSNLDTLLGTPLTYANGNPIVLRQAVQLQDAQAPVRIGRTNRELVLNIRANPTGRAAGDVSNDIEAALKANMVFPTGYTFQFSGGTQQQRTSFAAFGGALGLSVVLIYMLLVALYQSWMAPLSIMFALPVTIVGAFGGLLVTHRTLNIISLLGVILLTGIVTKNAILIIDFAEQLQEDGLTRKQALVQAGRLRLRPILMTTAALVFALLPLLFHSGAGSELRAPMAAVVIGGSLTSTLLSLLLVPVAYNTLEGFAGWTSRAMRRLAGTPPERLEEAPAPIGGGE